MEENPDLLERSGQCRAANGSESSKKEPPEQISSSSRIASTSFPLVPLQPAQQKPRSSFQDLGINRTHKLIKVHNPGRRSRPGSRERSPAPDIQCSKDIRQLLSDPVKTGNAQRELRGSKSAPDLTLPTLAAIRGLQAGTIHVDRKTRLRIANAARRVLEAREIKRRTSQTSDIPSSPTLTDELHSEPGSLDVTRPSSFTAQRLEGLRATDLSALQSLSAAAAIARGEELPSAEPEAPPSSFQEAKDETSNRSGTKPSPTSHFHRPTFPSPESGTGAHKPFTVTTGVPRFASGRSTSKPTPTTPTQLNRQFTRSTPIPNSMDRTLSASDLPPLGAMDARTTDQKHA